MRGTPIAEADKKRLVDFLLSRVRTGLSGRDGEDIVDASPDRIIFSGVLAPPRAVEVEAARRGVSVGEAPTGTSLGLDFRVRAEGSGPVRLVVRAQWSHYYPVFPSWDVASQAYQSGRAPEALEDSLAEDSDLGDVNTQMPDQDLGQDEEAEVGEQETAQDASGQVMLPRVWRRRDVLVDGLAVPLLTREAVRSAVGQTETAEAITSAKNQILTDPDGWRHLGDPKERQRLLGTGEVLASREGYAAALQRVVGERSALPPWSAAIQLDSEPDPVDPELTRVRILLSNTTPELRLFGPDREADIDPLLQERSLFDAGLAVEIENAVIVPFEFLLAPKDYRSDPSMVAKGINCVAVPRADVAEGLETETLPVFSQPLYRTREDLEVRFANLDVENPAEPLLLTARAMDEYLQTWDRFLSQQAPARLSQEEIRACVADREEFRRETERFKLGIEVLKRDVRLASAFRLMNRTFETIASRSGGRISAWRLFQIGFIVSQLPSLAAREIELDDSEYASALRESLREVGVLWFPTGGGKTEAYLGLIATAMLYDRLRGKQRGVTAWMRFPLRMLSLQQLDRLLRVVAVLNETRATEPALLAGDPFAVGYYVGSGNTPNRLSPIDMTRLSERDDVRERAKQIRSCPHCGSQVQVKGDSAAWRLVHYCLNAECFSNTSTSMGAYRGSLPLLVVDNEIYRYLPSVLVGTVDKLAIAGLNKYFAHIPRGASQRCPVHGYTSYDQCIEQGDRAGGCSARKRDLTPVPPFRDPGPALLIQDELHLLRDELGVFNGHYEGLLQYLGAKTHLPPKVLAATATIEAYDVQAFHIYLSRARRYPQPAWEQGESFYATSQPARQRRLYVGVLGHTRAIEEPALRILALYQREIRRLAANPAQATAIMDRPDLDDEAVLAVLRIYDLSLAYVNRRATGGSIVDKVPRQIDAILVREGLGTLQTQLLTGDQTIDVVGSTIERVEREMEDSDDPRLGLIVATNLISHGVDLERINMMTVCGMPSHYAEYVQASSRSARSHPGLIFVCFHGRDPREVSQFEFFPAMHEHMDRLIEAVAVNRFASFAPEKTVPGLLAAVLLHDLSLGLFARRQVSKPLDDIPTLLTALGRRPKDRQGNMAQCIDESVLLDALERIIGVDQDERPPASPSQIRNVKNRIAEVFEDQMGKIKRTDEKWLGDTLDVLTSFRDVDEGIEFGSFTAASYVDRIRG